VDIGYLDLHLGGFRCLLPGIVFLGSALLRCLSGDDLVLGAAVGSLGNDDTVGCPMRYPLVN